MILFRGVTLRFQGLADETLGLAMRFRKASPHIRGLTDQCAPGPQTGGGCIPSQAATAAFLAFCSPRPRFTQFYLIPLYNPDQSPLATRQDTELKKGMDDSVQYGRKAPRAVRR